MPKRTQHGHLRHSQEDRPTQEAFRDRNNPQEIYRDQNTQNWVFVGPQGKDEHTFFWQTADTIQVSGQPSVLVNDELT